MAVFEEIGICRNKVGVSNLTSTGDADICMPRTVVAPADTMKAFLFVISWGIVGVPVIDAPDLKAIWKPANPDV